MTLLGIDTGGTFTDFVLFDGHSLRIHKVLSTPEAPEQAILQGIRELGLEAGCGLDLVHGSTVATNAVLEGKGVSTVYITNRGLADILTIGRQARPRLYDLQPRGLPAPVAPEYCLETGGRLGADGRVVEPLTQADIDEVVKRVRERAPRAVAINLLFSFLSDRFERALEAALPDDLFVSRSSAVLPEYREYERGMATWLNAWVGPLVQSYLGRLHQALPGARLSVMQSSGDTIEAGQAGNQAVRMLLSGPAGGLAGVRFVAGLAGLDRLLTFDMGGTSTDVALIDGAIRLTSEGRIGSYPVAVPMVDMHTIGAGGGSIAYVDAGGLLQVGPESAGALPGPACYGRGGDAPTVTDANLVLGRLRPEAFLGGSMSLDVDAARQAVGKVAAQLELSVEAAALGIVRVANEHMAAALRVMSVQRGVDPRELTLVSFGGAGGLHVCALAEALSMSRAMVPIHAGVLSALGMLAAPRGRQLSRTLNGLLREFDTRALDTAFTELVEAGVSALAGEGVPFSALEIDKSVDLRYLGQLYTLNLPWQDIGQAERGFHELHRIRYGHALEQPVELVNLRVGVRGPIPGLMLTPAKGTVGASRETVWLSDVGEADVWAREVLAPGQLIRGPALITETVSTTYVAPNWLCRMSEHGNLLLELTPPPDFCSL